MKANYNLTIRKLMSEIRVLTQDLPQGRRNQVSNRLDKISSTIRKIQSHEHKKSNAQTIGRQIHC